MICVIETTVPSRRISEGYSCLYVRIERLPDGSYREYSYIGPTDEVRALAERTHDVAMEEVDKLLAGGSSFEDALTKLGVP
jgi:hypothetical protein